VFLANNHSRKMNELAVIPPATIQPKPTRAEIIDAMTNIRIEQLQAEQEKGLAEREKLRVKINAMIRREALLSAKTLNGLCDTGWVRTSDGITTVAGVEYRIQLTNISPELREAIIKMDKLPSYRQSIYFKDVRKQVLRGSRLAGASKDERINKLCSDPKSRKALEAALKEII
jgi:hypothetical protein